MGAPVLSSGGLGMGFGCGMKMIKSRNSKSILIEDVGGHEDLHFGPNAESASHHFHAHANFCADGDSQKFDGFSASLH